MQGGAGAGQGNDRGDAERYGEIRVEEYIKKPRSGTALRMMDIADRVSYEVDKTVEEENMVTNVVNHILGLNPMGIFYAVAG